MQEHSIMEPSSTRLALAASPSSSRLERVKWFVVGTTVSLSCPLDNAPSWSAHQITLTVLAVSCNLLQTFLFCNAHHIEHFNRSPRHYPAKCHPHFRCWTFASWVNRSPTSQPSSRVPNFILQIKMHFFLAIKISPRVSLKVSIFAISIKPAIFSYWIKFFVAFEDFFSSKVDSKLHVDSSLLRKKILISASRSNLYPFLNDWIFFKRQCFQNKNYRIFRWGWSSKIETKINASEMKAL